MPSIAPTALPSLSHKMRSRHGCSPYLHWHDMITSSVIANIRFCPGCCALLCVLCSHCNKAVMSGDWVLHGCRDQAPWQARAVTFAGVVASLGECMAVRRSLPASSLWRTAAGAFNAVVAAGLPAVNIAYVNRETLAPQDAWPALTEAFSALLLGAEPQTVSAADEGKVRAGTSGRHHLQSPPTHCICLSCMLLPW